jgi:hypothetical protein
LCVAGRSKNNIEVGRLDLKRMYFTASEHNTGGHFYVEVSFGLKGCLESQKISLEGQREKNDDENGSGKRIRG